MSTPSIEPFEPPRRAHSRVHYASQGVRRAIGAGPSLAMSLLGAGLLALAAVEAGLLVQPKEVRTEQTAPAAALGAMVSPAGQDTVPERKGNITGIACDGTTTGVTVFRLWSSGRIEAMHLGQSNVWGEWTPVAPGLSGAIAKKPEP